MATETTKKKSAPTVKKAEAKKAEAKIEETKNDAVAENALLKQQMAEMQAQMQAMMAMMGNNMSKQEEKKQGNRFIKFVSLKDSTLVLKGTDFWTIKGRFASRVFPEKEARIILMNQPEFIRQGSVYIADPQFVRDNDLETIYETLISDEDLKTLLDKKPEEVIEIYNNVNSNQKSVIVEYVASEKRSGREIDNNILVTLSGLCGKDLIHLDED